MLTAKDYRGIAAIIAELANVEYTIRRDSLGRYVVCACGRTDCAVTSYIYPADRAYRYDGPCTTEGHTAPVEVPLEIAESAYSKAAPFILMDNLTSALADYMARDNPQFQRDRFILACYS